MISSPSVTDDFLKNIVDNVCSMPFFNGIDKQLLFEELSTLYSTRVEKYQILTGR